MNLDTNKITKDDKAFRMILGALIILGTVLGFGNLFFFIVGGLTIASGVTGLCVIKSILK